MQVEGGTQNSVAVVTIVGDHCIVTFYFVHVINGKLYVLIQKVVYVSYIYLHAKVSIQFILFDFSLYDLIILDLCERFFLL